MTPAILAQDVVFRRPGGFTLRLAGWRVDPGERVAVHGPSGCGKSTLLNLIAGALVPDAGRLVVDDQDLASLSQAQRRAWRASRVGFVFQDFPLIDHLTVLDNVLLPFRLSRALILDADSRQRAMTLLEALSLVGHHRSRPTHLSQGERQRVAIARALITRPALLLADEPTAGLDPDQSAAVLSLLWSLSEHHGLTLVLVTHDPALLTRFSRRLDVASCTERT